MAPSILAEVSLAAWAQLLRKVADLVGDDGETHAGFAGAGGLHGGVQGEAVGLESDLINRLDDLGDIIAGDLDGGHRSGHGLHVGGAFVRGVAGLLGQVVGLERVLGVALGLLSASSSNEELVCSRDAACSPEPCASVWLAVETRRRRRRPLVRRSARVDDETSPRIRFSPVTTTKLKSMLTASSPSTTTLITALLELALCWIVFGGISGLVRFKIAKCHGFLFFISVIGSATGSH